MRIFNKEHYFVKYDSLIANTKYKNVTKQEFDNFLYPL